MPISARTSPRHWLLFIALAVIWGSSFYWQKFALRELGPSTVVALRFSIAFAIMLVVMAVRKLSFPRDARTWLGFAALSVVYSSVPVFLTAWAGNRIDSTLGSVLNATSPLFTVVFATLVFHDEAATRAKTIGTLIGFAGMLVIVLLGAADAGQTANDPLGVLAQAGTSVCYALAPILVRKLLKQQPVVVQSAALTGLAGATMWVAAVLTETVALPSLPITWVSILWLGCLASATANLLYFSLLKLWGSTRTSLVSYVIPIVGVLMGVLLLGERVGTAFVAGALLILVGVWIANRAMPS